MTTVGAVEGLAVAVMAIVDPGDEVILPTPTYSTDSSGNLPNWRLNTI